MMLPAQTFPDRRSQILDDESATMRMRNDLEPRDVWKPDGFPKPADGWKHELSWAEENTHGNTGETAGKVATKDASDDVWVKGFIRRLTSLLRRIGGRR